MVSKAKELIEEYNESGNFNVAKPYVLYKIMKHLYAIDECETMARFGTAELMDEFTMSTGEINQLRLKAINRLAHHLYLLCRNSIFAIRSVSDKEMLKEYQNNILKIQDQYMAKDKLYEIISNQKTKTEFIEINEDMFKLVLSALSGFAEKINEPLNKSELIFFAVDTFDPRKVKTELMQEFTEMG